MSGPYPPPGYPRPPEQGGWSGDQQQGQYGAPPPQHYEFPTVQYGGLAGPGGGWGGEPPRRRRSVGRLVVAVVSVLVIIGGVVAGALLLNHRHGTAQAADTAPTTTTVAATTTTEVAPTTTVPDPGLPNGSTTLTLAKGACVTAQSIANNQYKLGHLATCGTGQSDLVLAVLSPDLSGCPDHEYLRVSGPSAGVYCFTLDVKPGDCLDNSFLKAPCTTGALTVLKTEPGPGGANSCTDVTGATHWVPVGHDPVAVACIGPAKGS
ncbi:MAG TPA: hypothetical protein VH352_10170 [Pseudonocardiaceae bacterium]|jgi:hypothetical protein|nr:hypothetical protein [Pseudonocardiaceae bacterium]